MAAADDFASASSEREERDDTGSDRCIRITSHTHDASELRRPRPPAIDERANGPIRAQQRASLYTRRSPLPPPHPGSMCARPRAPPTSRQSMKLVPLNGSPPMPTTVDWPRPVSVVCLTASYLRRHVARAGGVGVHAARTAHSHERRVVG